MAKFRLNLEKSIVPLVRAQVVFCDYQIRLYENDKMSLDGVLRISSGFLRERRLLINLLIYK